MRRKGPAITDTTILHLTDLHFGCGTDSAQRAERDLILASLCNAVGNLEPEWKPHVACVTGDIGWAGKPEDYVKAEVWLKTLVDRLGLTFADVLVCAGNHDTSRDIARTIGRPSSAVEADEMLRPPIGRQFEATFTAFTQFCNRAGIGAYTFDGSESYLVGETQRRGIRFVALNSAWFCKGDDDQGKLWVGQPHFKILEANRVDLARPERQPTVALVHHPPDWWHQDETHAYRLRPNTLDYLAQRCNLILTGHTHAEVRQADQVAGGAFHLTGGASYAGSGHFNTFRLIRIESDRLVYRSFEFDPRSAGGTWSDRWGALAHYFIGSSQNPRRVANARLNIDLAALREASEADVQRTIEAKSRLLKVHGTLPVTLDVRVEVRVSSQIDQYDSFGQLQIDVRQVTLLSLYEACRASRRTVLLGDLGSGKSTLGALFVLETLERDSDAVAFLIPARALRLTDDFRLDDLLRACGEYLSAQVAVSGGQCDLRALLAHDIELTIVIDGLDEVSKPQAARLLRQLAVITDSWPNAQVLVTGRPIELTGVSYESWGLCHLRRLADAEKEAIFRAEAIADGSTLSEANEIAKRRLGVLKQHPMLDEIANTALAVRLLYPRLHGAVETQSIGDLLYDLLISRLGAWADQELKRSPYELFESRLTTPEQRAELFGTLVLAAPQHGPWTREAAEQVLLTNSGHDLLLAKQALAFFEQAGLLSLLGQVEFLFQPLVETAKGAAILSRWTKGERPVAASLTVNWRSVAFAASLARRRGLIGQVRPQIIEIVTAFLRSVHGVAAACMIVSESRDADTAIAAIAELRRLGRKPLRWFNEDRFTSSHAIAQTIQLAQTDGIDWFLDEYLDARYPILHRGSAVVDEVFAHWAFLAREKITERERSQLRPLVRPLIAGDGLFQILPVLALTVPDAFSEPERLWYVAAFLDHTLFGEIADKELTRAAGGAERLLLRTILQRYAERSRRAAPLFLRLFPGDRIPSSIMRGILHWWALNPKDHKTGEALNACKRSLGDAVWNQFLRWSLTDGDRAVATGAALLLHEDGERRLQVLGDVLLEALHDGGYVRRAEVVLGELLSLDREHSLIWLARRLADRCGVDGGHSGWWRLFLQLLDADEPQSPDILRQTMAGVGPFLLPRYPEVRDGLSRFLSGPDGERYRKALRSQLWQGNPRARHGAASVLVTCDPGSEGEALYSIVATRDEMGGYRNEWEAFCLSLAFGPVVLAGLHARLDQLNRPGRAFALSILHRRNFPLSTPERQELYASLLDPLNWPLTSALVWDADQGSEEWFDFLRSTLACSFNEIGRRAAKLLLSRFLDKLSPMELVKCRVWASVGHNFEGDLLKREIAQILTNEAYRTGLRPIFDDVARVAGHPCVLERVAEAATTPSAWQDVLWSLLSDTFLLEAEEGGELVLEIGRDHPEHADAIGAAATNLVNDARFAQIRRPEARQWLALLAHEFESLSPQEIRKTLLAGSPISWAAARALMARLHEVPEAMPRRNYRGDFPSDLLTPRQEEPEPVEAPMAALLSYGRIGTPHPETCTAIERLLLLPIVDAGSLSKIARQGVPGILIAETIRFCAGYLACLEDRLPLLVDLGSMHGLRGDQCFERLRQNVVLAHELALEDVSAQDAYSRLLNERLESQSNEVAPLATELLRQCGSIRPELLRRVFEDFALKESNFQADLGIALLRWVAELDEGPIVEPLASAAEHAVRILWERGPIPRGEARSPYPSLCLPLIVWTLRHQSNEASIGLYWRGIQRLFSAYSYQAGATDAMEFFEAAEPLVARIPQSLWDAVRATGKSFEDATVRSLIALFAGLTGGPTSDY